MKYEKNNFGCNFFLYLLKRNAETSFAAVIFYVPMITQLFQYYLTPRKLSQKRKKKKYVQKIAIKQPLPNFFLSSCCPVASGQIFSRTYVIMQIGSFKELKRRNLWKTNDDIEETTFWQGGRFLFSLMLCRLWEVISMWIWKTVICGFAYTCAYKNLVYIVQEYMHMRYISGRKNNV